MTQGDVYLVDSMTTETPVRHTRTVDEAAVLLGISRSKAYREVASGEIPSVAIGKRKLVPVTWLAEFLSVDRNTI